MRNYVVSWMIFMPLYNLVYKLRSSVYNKILYPSRITYAYLFLLSKIYKTSSTLRILAFSFPRAGSIGTSLYFLIACSNVI